MNQVINCQYCYLEYWDYDVYVMPEGSIMCKDCVRSDVPLHGDKVVA